MNTHIKINTAIFKVAGTFLASWFLIFQSIQTNAQQVIVPFNSSTTWTCPAGVTAITVECWGGGGAGASVGGNPAAGGGGAGGAYARSWITVVPGTIYQVTVGSSKSSGNKSASASQNEGNPSWFGSTATILAAGGAGAAGGSNTNNYNGAAALGTTTGSIGDVVFAGGNGANGTSASGAGGGAGGGAAGPSANGGNASGATGGTGASGNPATGNGGAGPANSSVGNDGFNYGGGGSGGKANSNSDKSGGAGAGGFVQITYTTVDQPSNLTATTVSGSKIDLSWMDNSANESGFEIENSTTSGSNFQLVTTTAAGTTSYQVTGLISGTTYYFRIRSIATGAFSGYTAEASATTLVQPAAPSNLVASTTSLTSIDLAWADNSSSETSFEVERSETSGSGFQVIQTLPANSTSFSNTGLISGTTYFYRVRASNLGEYSPYTAEASATTYSIPATPSGLTATATGLNSINLTWVDNSNNEDNFIIEHSTTSGSGFTLLTTEAANTTSYNHTGLSPGTVHYYRMYATNAGGNSSYSAEASTTTLTLPTAPTGLTAVASSSTSLNLNWIDNSNNESGFVIEQSTPDESNYVPVFTTQANATTYAPGSLSPNTVYYFRIKATNAGGSSAYTSGVTATTWDLTEQAVDDWAFQYRYDDRRRMIMKKVPGADWVYMVYDERDRLVMTQDGEQRNINRWTYTSYDVLNRPIITGLYTHTAAVDQATMSGLISTTNFYETRDDLQPHGYTATVFNPASFDGTFDVLTVTYYDDYSFRGLAEWGSTYNYVDDNLSATVINGTYNQQDVENLRVNGLVTGTKTKVLDDASNFIKTILYYDDKYRSLQTITDNYLNGAMAGTDRTSMLYDFPGKVLKTQTQHNLVAGTPANVVSRRITYDQAGRAEKVYHLLGTNPADEVQLVGNLYNELGQLVDKQLHSTDGVSFKQYVDYRYNIRGWLTKINDATAAPAEGDLFSMNLNYNSGTTNGGTPQFNGNISEILWRGPDALTNSYGYYYDPMNRLQEAKFFSSDVTLNGRHDEKIWDVAGNKSGYDLNGNIKFLTRMGKIGENPATGAYIYGLMDDLTYNYGTKANQLQSVDDAAVDTEGFKEGASSGNDYSYDDNGNMRTDQNKDISNIQYNHLNLPATVTKTSGEYIQYIYDATGRKLRQEVFNASSVLQKHTDYAGEFIYEGTTGSGALQFINHEEGRIIPSAGAAEYQYHLKDHLGNVRLTFTTVEETVENTATLEPANAIEEEGEFLRYSNAKTVNSILFDKTNGNSTGYAQRLNGTAEEKFGIAKSISVMPGDVIQAEVYAKYVDTDPGNWTAALNSLISQINAGTAGVVMDGTDYPTSTSSFPFGGLLNTGGSMGGPKAYLNWLVFDADYNFLPGKSGYKRMSTDAREFGQDVAHELLSSPSIIIDKPGYVYIYLSNEELESAPVEVYFDDLKVTQTQTPVVQMDDYYPFGLTFNSYSRENSVPNSILYNSRELQDELNLGWYDYIARQYDPAIGRFLSIDPLADLSRRWSPYVYGFDNPVRFIDPDGMLPEDKVDNRPRGATMQEGDHEDRMITVTRSGKEGEYSHTTTETNTKTNGSYQRDADGNLQWKESTTTTTSSTVTDANGDLVSSSQTVTSSENVFAVKEATQLHLFGPDEKVNMVGDLVSSNNLTTTSDNVSSASNEFKAVVSMTADYSRMTNGLSITQTNTNWLVQNMSNNMNDNGMPDSGSMVALSLPALFERGPTQTFHKSCGNTILKCSVNDNYLKAIRTGTAGYIQSK